MLGVESTESPNAYVRPREAAGYGYRPKSNQTSRSLTHRVPRGNKPHRNAARDEFTLLNLNIVELAAIYLICL
jgi:hypothetical protein